MILVLEEVEWPYYCCLFYQVIARYLQLYMCETVLVSRVYNVSVILCLQWMVYVGLYHATSVLNFHVTASRSICLGAKYN